MTMCKGRFQMNDRFVVLVSGLVVPAAVMWLATMPVAGQGRSAGARTSGNAAKSYTAPRTPDGQPDLQGIWSNTTITPLERPKNVTTEFFTPEEALEAAKRAAAEESEQTEPGTVADVHYDFTQFGLDRSSERDGLEPAHIADRRPAGRQDFLPCPRRDSGEPPSVQRRERAGAAHTMPCRTSRSARVAS